MDKLLTKHVKNVFAKDGYGGIIMIELDWQQDCTWERGDLNDGYHSIEDYFENTRDKWYDSLEDCVTGRDPYTEITYNGVV